MSDTYFDLPSRLEDSFPEIDSDIVTDLRKTSEEYDEIQQQSLYKRTPVCFQKAFQKQLNQSFTISIQRVEFRF